MSQIFQRSTNTIAKVTIFGLLVLIAGSLWLMAAFNRSSYTTQQNVIRDQPVPFSHQRHVGGNGIDCRYCHTSVEESSFAGIPPTETCMTCHSQVLADAPMLEPVRESYKNGTPLQWTRVHDLADFVYFNHSIHVAKGVGCATCHGPVNEMPLMWQTQTLQMEWCLECHRAPEQFIRPKDRVFDMEWKPEGDQVTMGRKLVDEYHINVGQLTDCSVCHR